MGVIVGAASVAPKWFSGHGGPPYKIEAIVLDDLELIGERRDARQLVASEEFERGAAAG